MSYDPFVGEIKIFGFNFAPRGHAFCNGGLIPINQNSALFALLGTTYGGNGTSTFALPDLRGRAAKGFGQGPGLPSYVMGEAAGTPSVTLTTSQLPVHTHGATGITANLPVSSELGTEESPVGNFLAQTPIDMYSSAASAGKNYGTLATAASGNTAATGGSQPIDIQNPYLVVNYSIALEGIFPNRN